MEIDKQPFPTRADLESSKWNNHLKNGCSRFLVYYISGVFSVQECHSVYMYTKDSGL